MSLKNKEKRKNILHNSKILFAQKGFYNTSISDIAGRAEIPVGSIYTYFKSKEEIVQEIINEGWSNLRLKIKEDLLKIEKPIDQIKVLIDDFLPKLFNDIELINILLTEAIQYTKIEEKMEQLLEIISPIFINIAAEKKIDAKKFFSPTMQAGIIILFLGIMNTVKLSYNSTIDI